LNFDKTFAPIARLESISILLAYATHQDFKLYQMDVKSTFLNGPIKDEVYVEQPLGFEDEEYSNHIYKLHKVLYGLKQAPRVWYECLLFSLEGLRNDLFVFQIYVDDIIFCSTNQSFCDEFSKIMTERFEMSMMGELKFFLVFKSSKLKMGHS
jgi:hypothetical protein